MADEDTPENKTKAKSRKRYEIPKTATCNVCGEYFVICSVHFLHVQFIYSYFVALVTYI